MKRILAVDDEPVILGVLMAILEADGYEVHTADSSKDARIILSHQRFDLVITDFDMPDMKGDELSRVIKEVWPETPVLMLSGSADLLRASAGELRGVDSLINKPFDLVEFRCEIARLLTETSSASDLPDKTCWQIGLQAGAVLNKAFG